MKQLRSSKRDGKDGEKVGTQENQDAVLSAGVPNLLLGTNVVSKKYSALNPGKTCPFL